MVVVIEAVVAKVVANSCHRETKSIDLIELERVLESASSQHPVTHLQNV